MEIKVIQKQQEQKQPERMEIITEYSNGILKIDKESGLMLLAINNEKEVYKNFIEELKKLVDIDNLDTATHNNLMESLGDLIETNKMIGFYTGTGLVEDCIGELTQKQLKTFRNISIEDLM